MDWTVDNKAMTKEQEMKKVVINKCFGGFGLSDMAYEKLNEWGVPIRGYIQEPRNPKTGLYDIHNPNNEGEVIFDSTLDEDKFIVFGRYWDTWLSDNREHPLLIKVVEELGDKASGRFSELKIVEIPKDVSYEIDEYDGLETIHEIHRSWD